MKEWAVAVILIGVSLVFAAILFGICKLLGGWTWIYAWITGNKEERMQLATNEQYGSNGYKVNTECGAAVSQVQYNQYSGISSEPKRTPEPRPPGEPTVLHSIPRPVAQPPSDPQLRRFSLDMARKGSLDTELPDVLSFDSSGATKLQRAMSCDSVCSDTSVVLETLDSPQENGELEVGLEFSKTGEELIVIVNRAKRLGNDPDCLIDCYVRVCLLPDQSTNMQTGIQRSTNDPVFRERFLFGVSRQELPQRSVLFYIYSCDKYTNTLIGEAELKLSEVDIDQPYTAWLPVLDSNQKSKGLGDLMFSLSYLPTAERLTVVVVKARNVKFTEENETADPFVKVYLLQKGKKISKKKTSIKKGEKNPVFNEAMIFSVPAMALQNIQMRLTMAEYHADGKTPSIGHIFVGPQCSGKCLSHWNQMMSSPRKPIAMWHPLRK